MEKKGRDIAICEMKKRGYEAVEMPQENPGFDLHGRKNGEELRVEVKAHTGKATVIDLTQRQYKEYLSQQGYSWELWNVEHLDEHDLQKITLTPYNKIPDEALNTSVTL